VVRDPERRRRAEHVVVDGGAGAEGRLWVGHGRRRTMMSGLIEIAPA
jgi:hypothetical protein